MSGTIGTVRGGFAHRLAPETGGGKELADPGPKGGPGLRIVGGRSVVPPVDVDGRIRDARRQDGTAC